MSTRAQIASALASIGVLALGWQVGTANGQTVATTSTSTKTTTTTGTTSSGSTSNTRAGTTTTTATGSSKATTSGTTSAATTSLNDGTYTGATSSNRFGSVTVAITVAGGKIATVNATANANDNRSAQINSRAMPVLKSATLSAQSAKISTVSGATYTTNSYRTSLQSALDKAAA